MSGNIKRESANQAKDLVNTVLTQFTINKYSSDLRLNIVVHVEFGTKFHKPECFI